MKKNYSFIIAAMIIAALALTACSSSAEEDVPAGMEGQTYGCLGTAEDALVDLECQEVTIAVENAYLPFNYISSETGEAGGWDYEVFVEICTLLHCQPVFVETAWEGMIQSIADGLMDVAGDGVTVNDTRLEIVDFSDGYVNIEQRLLVANGEDRFGTIEEFAANEEWILGTQSQTSNYETATGFLPEERILGFDQFPFAVQALIAGDVDAVLIDEVAGLGYLGTSADQLELIGPSIESNVLGFPFPKGSDLVEPFNLAIAEMKQSGFLETINLKYFGPDFTLTYDDIE